MKNNSIAVISSHEIKQRSNDTNFPFRQNSNFYYVTGFSEDEAKVVLCKKEGKCTTTMFLHPKDPLKEMWEGKRLGKTKALDALNVDEAFEITSFETEFIKLLKNTQTLYSQSTDAMSIGCLNKQKMARESHLFPLNISDIDALVFKLRRKKQTYEIEMISQALKLTKVAHHAAMAKACPSKNEYEIMALVEYIFKSGGASWDAYTTIVAGGNSANTLHYIENNRRLVDGELILMDAGAEYNLYASDITRTFAVNGKFTTPQKELYEIVLQTQKKVICEMAPGVYRSSIANLAVKDLSQGLHDIKVINKSVDEIIEKELYKPYYPHGIGHWMGLDVHDPMVYRDSDDKELCFEEGDILTIEPGLYLDASDENIPKAFRGIGIRIEDDILITKDGHKNLSEDIVKEISDVEDMSEKSIYDYI